MKYVPLALAFILLAGMAGAFWVQNLAVSVKDASGGPIPDAQIEVHYQKSSRNGELDGYISGFTDEKGAFSAKLTNTVQTNEVLDYTVSVNTFFWEGQQQTLNAVSGREASNAVTFTYSLPLSTYNVKVLDIKKNAVHGAAVTLSSPIFASRTTDAKGVAVFRMPANTQISGTAALEGVSTQFDSSSAKLSGGAFEITATLSSDFSTGTTAVSHTLDLQILDSKKQPIANLPISVSPPNPPRTVKTDTSGRIRLLNVPYSSLNISFTHNSYPYSQTIDPIPSEPIVIELHSLLKITNVRIQRTDSGCSQIFAKVADDRPSAQNSVYASYGGEAIPKNFELVGPNQYAVAICSPNDANVTITASNQFESATASVFIRGVTIVNIVNNTELEVGKTVEQPIDEDASRLLIVLQVLFLTVLLATLFIFRGSIVYAIRCISQYVRNILGKKGPVS